MDEKPAPINGKGNGAHHSNPAALPSAAEASGVSPVAPVEASKPEGSAGSPKARVKLKAQQIAFLSALEEGLTITGACRAAKMSRQNHYNWLQAVDKNGAPTVEAEVYRGLFDEALRSGTEVLIDEAKRRAVEGWEEPRFNKHGDEVGRVRRYDSTLLMFLIKQRDPSFRERYEVTGANGSPLHPSKITVDHRHEYAEALKSLTDEELDQHNAIAAKLLARATGPIRPGTN